MDFNGPRSYLNKIPQKLVRIIDAIGDQHTDGNMVLISHKSCVSDLAKASRHGERIITAHFGGLRGRNDLESTPHAPIACHIVAGSPKTTEEDRRQLALAVFGPAILPFPALVQVRRSVVGLVPPELVERDGDALVERIWEVRMRWYHEPRMQAVYDHAVTSELTQAADRARVLIHPEARVYLVTNEPCPRLWFAELTFSFDYLDLSPGSRSDFEGNFAAYETAARALLDADRRIGNADVCRSMSKKPGWGKRYWQRLIEQYCDAMEGERKMRWRHGRADSQAEVDQSIGKGEQGTLAGWSHEDGPYQR
jgi:hypothetical protein